MPKDIDSWKKYWCRHCRCTAGKENKPIKYHIIVKNIKTKKTWIKDKVCENCVDNIGYNEPDYNED